MPGLPNYGMSPIITIIYKHENDVGVTIFDYFSLTELLRVSRVCSEFYHMTGNRFVIEKFKGTKGPEHARKHPLQSAHHSASNSSIDVT